MSNILWFEQVNAGDIEHVGGKGANLGEMTAAGLPVPSGFCVTAGAYRRVIAEAGLWAQIEGLLADTSINSAPAEIAKRIQQLVNSAPMPDDVKTAVTAAYSQLKGNDPAVAVRSSATAEDLPEASFAGQQETYLGVRGEMDLLDHVQLCWASLWAERAIAYRQRNGFPHEQVSLSVVVQLMVQPETAGVLFTVNPLTGERDEMLVNAAYGLGESVVSGQVTPDNYRLSPSAKRLIVEQTIGAKETRIDALPDGGVQTQAVAAADRQRLCLTPSQLQELADLGTKIERHYQSPQDIEWAFADGALYLLQTRPVTTLTAITSLAAIAPSRSRTLSKTEHRILDDILEHYPDPPYPLDYAAVTDGYEQVQKVMREAGMDAPAADAIIQMDKLGIPFVDPIAPRLTWKVMRIPSLLRQKLSLNPERWQAEQTAVFAARLADLRQTDVATLTDDGLAVYIKTAVSTASEIGGIRFSEYIVPMIVRGIGLKMLIRLVNREGAVVEADLLGELAYKTAVIDHALQALAAKAEQSPTVRAVLLDSSMDEALDALKKSDAGRQFLQQFNAFLDEHGARTMKMYLPFSNRSWSEYPASLMATLAVLVRAGTAKNSQGNTHFQQFRDRTAHKLPSFLRRRFLRTMELYRAGHVAREATLYAIEESFVIARRGTMEAARRLAARGMLTAVDDIRFLTLPELTAILTQEVELLKTEQLIAQRQQARPQATAVWLDRGVKIEMGDGSLKGQPGSPGIASGPVRIIHGPAEFSQLQAGDVLVCAFTDPAWTPLFSLATAVVADTGGSLSHAAIVAREYGIPAVLGTQVATTQLENGMTVTVDGGRGVVVVGSNSTYEALLVQEPYF